MVLLSPHEIGRLPERPRPLRLIENRNMLDWRVCRVLECSVAEVVNVLNKLFHDAKRLALSQCFSFRSISCDVVPCESLSQYRYERTVPRQVNSRCTRVC